MTELENKLAEKILEKIDMDKLTDKIAEKAAELIIQKEYPDYPVIPPFEPGEIWPKVPEIQPQVLMYGVPPVEYKPTSAVTEYIKENTEE